MEISLNRMVLNYEGNTTIKKLLGGILKNPSEVVGPATRLG